MVEQFLLKYFPPDKTAKYQASITGFRTDEDESLHTAWERYKSLLRRCLYHGLNKWLQFQTFFDAQSSPNKQAIDQIVGGDLGTKSPNEAFEILEKAAKKSFAYNPPRSTPSHKGMHQVDSNTLVTAQLEALSKKFEQLQTELVKAKTKCDTCGGDHKTKYCQQSMIVEEVDFVSRQNNTYGNIYNPGWRNHPNFSWQDGQSSSSGQLQGNDSKIESMFAQIIAGNAEAQNRADFSALEVNEVLIKHDADIKSQKASLQTLENQLGQIARQLSERQPGGLPSNTVNNPNAAVNAITLRSGRTTMVTEPTSDAVVTEKETEIPEEVQERLVPTSTARPKEPVRTYIPPISYPARLKNERLEAQYGKFLELFKQLHIKVPFIEALSQMPKYAKFLKDVLTNKRKLEELSHVTLNEECSTILQNKLPEKMTDSGSFTIPCLIGRLIYPISDSPWVCPVQVVPNKGGMTVEMNEKDELIPMRTVIGWRVCIDCHKLNDSTRKDNFPLLFIDQMLERLSGKMFYCFLDGFSGYFQIPIAPEDQEKTTFTCPYGTFAYRRMPFGLCNAPATFQRCMVAIFHEMIEHSMEVFMDDFSIFGYSFDHCLKNIDKMLTRC
ncbi:uncharacterized protein LOC143599957 [Bidens hawaiensis]|uniref:uncharacterized protein LOC143599957 n=1 Tax=Bidens hawaiensis TaxID=980011 RepID=UPI0040491EB2